MREFDAATVRQLLDELKGRLSAKGVRGTIKVAGGAAMLLNYPDDPDVRVTTDIDALIEPNDEIDEVVAEMAHDLELPRHGSTPPARAGCALPAISETIRSVCRLPRRRS